MMGPQQLEKEYLIHVYETGPDGRLNLHSLFNYMQDIASDHAVLLGFGRDDLMKSNHFWVLSRMYAEISGWPEWEDKIIVKTWPSGTDKLFAIRNYEVRFPDGRLIAIASSSWLIIDRTSKKIQRPGELLSQYNPVSNDGLPVRLAIKLSEFPGAGLTSSEFRVKISDLDVNFHTNNVRYLNWVTDTYDLNFTMHHLPCSAEINYLAESIFNDEIVIRTLKEEGSTGFFGHSVLRAGDNKELCRIRLGWKADSI
jgi:medium-chain acyl-[acyl-carrier-protein] hydrolase